MADITNPTYVFTIAKPAEKRPTSPTPPSLSIKTIIKYPSAVFTIEVKLKDTPIIIMSFPSVFINGLLTGTDLMPIFL